MEAVREAILEDRFYHPGEQSWLEVCHRTADAWATPNTAHWGDTLTMLAERKGLPNTPAIANAGRPNATGSACYVLPVNDSLVDGEASIMQTLMDAAAVHKSGGGVGFSFGRIRAKGSLVKSTGRPAPGPVNVLQLYSDTFKRVTQAGMRPGANMGILPVTHPDVLDFIHSKTVEGDMRNFNISVALDDDFMTAALLAGPGEQRHDLFMEIALAAWHNGEPGVFFIDTANKARLHPEEFEATNPCGEVPLRPYEACVLGSVNLAEHCDGVWIDWEGMASTIYTLVELLDNVVEHQHYALPIIKQEQQRYRKIGVGVMGFAELLVKMGVKYSSDVAVDYASEIMRFVQDISYGASKRLADERGLYAGWQEGMPYRRNLNCNVIAPTGTIARLAMTPGFGIEPFFDTDDEGQYQSFICGGQFVDVNPYHEWAAYETSSDVPWEQHVRIMAAFQEYTDQAVSKTINLPHDASVQDVARAYMLAWELGCKGLTVLRDESRVETVINNDCESGVCAL